jgi:hypothetical protein
VVFWVISKPLPDWCHRTVVDHLILDIKHSWEYSFCIAQQNRLCYDYKLSSKYAAVLWLFSDS